MVDGFRRAAWRVLWIGWLLAVASPVSALSCFPLKDEYFVTCRAGQCKEEFRAKEIQSGGACGRRIVVEPIPDGVLPVLLEQLSVAGSVMPHDGKYQISLAHRFYRPLPVGSEELRRELQELVLMSPKVGLLKLDDGTEFAATRKDFESRSTDELLRVIGYWSVEVVSLLVALVVTFKAMISFRRELMANFPQGARLSSAGRIFAIQCIPFGAGLVEMAYPFGPFLLTLMIPILLLVWMYQFLLWIVHGIRAKRARSAQTRP